MADKALCKIDDCNKPVCAWGWCEMHYRRWKRTGDPYKLTMRPSGEALQYYHETVLPYDGDECLIWPYTRHTWGYGQVRLDGQNAYVHRLVCAEEHGPPLSAKYEAAHSCGNGHLGCVAKRHLSWKTPTENAADKAIHGTLKRGEQHYAAKLTEEAVIVIRSSKETAAELAARYRVHENHISLVRTRKRWAHIIP